MRQNADALTTRNSTITRVDSAGGHLGINIRQRQRFRLNYCTEIFRVNKQLGAEALKVIHEQNAIVRLTFATHDYPLEYMEDRLKICRSFVPFNIEIGDPNEGKEFVLSIVVQLDYESVRDETKKISVVINARHLTGFMVACAIALSNIPKYVYQE